MITALDHLLLHNPPGALTSGYVKRGAFDWEAAASHVELAEERNVSSHVEDIYTKEMVLLNLDRWDVPKVMASIVITVSHDCDSFWRRALESVLSQVCHTHM